MIIHPLKVVRLDLPLYGASFDAIINAEPTLSLQIGPAFGDTAAAWQALSTANVYHVSSARDDMPAPRFVATPLLARCPDLLAVSSCSLVQRGMSLNEACISNQK